ncbi:MAG: hypothetical protein JWQ69_2662 [Pseudomonas sp.]|nr:hypothetical protein [Pseudomonas sp.]
MPFEAGRESVNGAMHLRVLSNGLHRYPGAGEGPWNIASRRQSALDGLRPYSSPYACIFAYAHDSVAQINAPVAHRDAFP